MLYLVASFPGLPCFLFFSLCSVQYTEAEEWRKKKQGRPENTYHVNDVWWMQGGRRGGRGGGAHLQTFVQKNIDWVSYWWSWLPSISWTSGYHWSGQQSSLVRYLNVGHFSSTSTRRHSCDGGSQAFPLFCQSSASVIILNANRRKTTTTTTTTTTTKKWGEAWEQGYAPIASFPGPKRRSRKGLVSATHACA